MDNINPRYQPLMTQEEIKSFILSGCKFEYDSYDFKKAKEDFLESDNGKEVLKNPYFLSNAITNFEIPIEYKRKHSIKRIGKLRDLKVNPVGDISSVSIGNKRAKTFRWIDFGDSVKPILSPFNDSFGLIKRGLAIDAIKELFK